MLHIARTFRALLRRALRSHTEGMFPCLLLVKLEIRARYFAKLLKIRIEKLQYICRFAAKGG
jgi:hypothetical protein